MVKMLAGFAVVALLLVPGTASAGGRTPTGTISAPSSMAAGQSYLVTVSPGYTPKGASLYIAWGCPSEPRFDDMYPITLADPTATVLARGVAPEDCAVVYEVDTYDPKVPSITQYFVARQDVTLTSG